MLGSVAENTAQFIREVQDNWTPPRSNKGDSYGRSDQYGQDESYRRNDTYGRPARSERAAPYDTAFSNAVNRAVDIPGRTLDRFYESYRDPGTQPEQADQRDRDIRRDREAPRGPATPNPTTPGKRETHKPP
jgi:hypothetical protein